jgi:hypothetical protein
MWELMHTLSICINWTGNSEHSQSNIIIQDLTLQFFWHIPADGEDTEFLLQILER